MNRTNSFCGILLLLLVCLPVSAQEGPTEEKKPASLYGMAINSLTAEPLPHVEVWLLHKISGRFSSYRHAVTGPDGRFSLTGIDAGSYYLTAERNGYYQVDVKPSDDPPMLSLNRGEAIKDILLKLAPDAVISGRVVDADGVPMEHIKVQALGSLSTETDDRGEFVLGGLSAGRYLLKASLNQSPLPEVRKDGSVAINYEVSNSPSSKTLGGVVPIRVQAGQERAIEIKMVPAPVLHVSGNVVGDITSPQLSIHLENWWDDFRAVTIDDKGAFTFWKVPAGRYRLFAESSNDKGHLQSAPVFIEVTNANVEGIHLTLLPSIGLTARIRDEDWQQVTAQIKGDRGVARIALEPLGFFREIGYSCELSDQGRFETKSVAAGRYHVRMTNLPKNFYVKSLQVGEREFQDGTLEIGGGPEQQEMLIGLGANGAEVSGIVRDATGGARQAVVFLLFDDASRSGVTGSASTSEDGRYIIHGIAPGKYRLLALKTKYAGQLLTDEELELDRNLTEKIEVRDGDSATQDLTIVAP